MAEAVTIQKNLIKSIKLGNLPYIRVLLNVILNLRKACLTLFFCRRTIKNLLLP